MAETGFGSLSFSPAPTYFDWGFGSLTPTDIDTGAENIEGADTGFGSPYSALSSEAFLQGEFDLIPDDGGVILEINADWALFGKKGQILGPFTVTYVSSSDGSTTLSTGLARRGECFTNAEQTKLLAGVPPLPHDTYDILVEWFGGTRSVYIDNAFTVSLRTRCEQAYGIRRHMPAWLKRGPIAAHEEQLEAWTRGPNLEAITKAVGDLLQNLAGRPLTCLTAEVSMTDTYIFVESTIGFPSSGTLSIEGLLFSYSGKTSDSFLQVSCNNQFDPIPSGQEVYYAVTVE